MDALSLRIPKTVIEHLANDLVHAVAYLHLDGIAHMDLSIANVMVCVPDDGSGTTTPTIPSLAMPGARFKLIDLGNAASTSMPMRAPTWCVAPAVSRAPENIAASVDTFAPYMGELIDCYRADMWAIGSILAYVTTHATLRSRAYWFKEASLLDHVTRASDVSPCTRKEAAAVLLAKIQWVTQWPRGIAALWDSEEYHWRVDQSILRRAAYHYVQNYAPGPPSQQNVWGSNVDGPTPIVTNLVSWLLVMDPRYRIDIVEARAYLTDPTRCPSWPKNQNHDLDVGDRSSMFEYSARLARLMHDYAHGQVLSAGPNPHVHILHDKWAQVVSHYLDVQGVSVSQCSRTNFVQQSHTFQAISLANMIMNDVVRQSEAATTPIDVQTTLLCSVASLGLASALLHWDPLNIHQQLVILRAACTNYNCHKLANSSNTTLSIALGQGMHHVLEVTDGHIAHITATQIAAQLVCHGVAIPEFRDSGSCEGGLLLAIISMLEAAVACVGPSVSIDYVALYCAEVAVRPTTLARVQTVLRRRGSVRGIGERTTRLLSTTAAVIHAHITGLDTAERVIVDHIANVCEAVLQP
jgi:serine/threonine protein kinase